MGRKFEKVSRVKGIDFEMPKRSTKNSAGYDFINPERIEIEPGEIKYVKTGIKAYFEEDEMLMLCNRSSNPKKKGLIVINGFGVVECDYADNIDNEGELCFAFMNIKKEKVVIEAGEKLGQGIFVKFLKTENDEADTVRVGGFGSTGK